MATNKLPANTKESASDTVVPDTIKDNKIAKTARHAHIRYSVRSQKPELKGRYSDG